MTLVTVESLDCRYGLLQAVRGVSFEIGQGETVALIGANGAGKTTLMRAVAGAHRPHGGRVVFDGIDITRIPAHRRVALGIALVPEGRRLFPGLTVEENLRVATSRRRGRWNVKSVLEVFPLLQPRRHVAAANLSGGEQQAVAIGRALMSNPRLLLLDEVSLGLAPVVVDPVYPSLTDVIREGATALLVQQDPTRALKVAGRAVLQGIFLGAFYAVLACGLSIMFGVMRIINLAHGDVAVLGAYIVFVIVEHTGVSAFVAFAAALPVMVVLGYILQLTVLERSLKAGILTPLLATFGLSIVIQNLLQLTFSPDVHSLGGSAGVVTTSSWQVTSGLSVSALGIVVLAVAVLVFGALQVFLSRTRAGWVMRATAEDADAAELVGIDSRSVYARATAIAVAIAALGGLFLGIRSVFDPVSGPTQLIFAFEAVVIGGMGSLWGTLFGGIALGVAQTLGAQVHPQFAVMAGHLLFLAVLIVRFGGGRAVLPGVRRALLLRTAR